MSIAFVVQCGCEDTVTGEMVIEGIATDLSDLEEKVIQILAEWCWEIDIQDEEGTCMYIDMDVEDKSNRKWIHFEDDLMSSIFEKVKQRQPQK